MSVVTEDSSIECTYTVDANWRKCSSFRNGHQSNERAAARGRTPRSISRSTRVISKKCFNIWTGLWVLAKLMLPVKTITANVSAHNKLMKIYRVEASQKK